MQALAHKIASELKRRSPDHPSTVEELQFSLEAIINTLGTIVLALAISIFTHRTHGTIIALQSFALLRLVSGGIHLKYSWTCTAATSIVANMVSFVSFPPVIVSAMTVVSLVLALAYAPSRIDQQTRIPQKYYPLLKVLSCLIVASNFFIGSSIIATSFLIQCALLIRKRR